MRARWEMQSGGRGLGVWRGERVEKQCLIEGHRGVKGGKQGDFLVATVIPKAVGGTRWARPLLRPCQTKTLSKGGSNGGTEETSMGGRS